MSTIETRRRLHLVPTTADILAGVDLAPQDAAAALVALETVAARLRARGDARAVFPHVYGVVTRRVVAEIRNTRDPLFLEPAWIDRLSGRFCELYLVALADSLAGRRPESTAWTLAHQQATHGATLPVQDALMGINAHINYDLAQGLMANVRASNPDLDPALMARYKHDHDAVNGILRASNFEILEILDREYGCPAARLVRRSRRLEARLIDAVVGVLGIWREDVWGDLLALLAAEGEAERREVLARTDRESALYAQLIAATSVGVLVTGRLLEGLRRGRAAVRAPTTRVHPLAA